MLKYAQAGAKTKELCRRHGISDATLYKWKAKNAGMDGMTGSEARWLKELEAENSKLKRVLADVELDKAALKDILTCWSIFGPVDFPGQSQVDRSDFDLFLPMI